MSAVSRRRFLTGAPAVAIAAVLRPDLPSIDDDRREILQAFLNGDGTGPMDSWPSHSLVHRATAAALLDLNPKEER